MSSESGSSSSSTASFKKPSRAPSSLGPLVVNLMKNCVGAGVFSIHSRVATATGNLPLPYVGALVYLMASWATYNFYIIGETCKLTNSSTYSEAWSKSISQKTQWIVQTVVILAPIVSCLANVIVLTDILGLLFKSVGLPVAVYANRNLVITLLSAVVLFPLCIQSNLSGLKSVSTLGLAGHLLAMGALVVRLLDKSYLPGGQFYKSLLAIPAVVNSPASNAAAAVSVAKWSTLASLLSYCYVTHYNVSHRMFYFYMGSVTSLAILFTCSGSALLLGIRGEGEAAAPAGDATSARLLRRRAHLHRHGTANPRLIRRARSRVCAQRLLQCRWTRNAGKSRLRHVGAGQLPPHLLHHAQLVRDAGDKARADPG